MMLMSFYSVLLGTHDEMGSRCGRPGCLGAPGRQTVCITEFRPGCNRLYLGPVRTRLSNLISYCFVITPVNYSLAAVNFFVGSTGLVQLLRIA